MLCCSLGHNLVHLYQKHLLAGQSAMVVAVRLEWAKLSDFTVMVPEVIFIQVLFAVFQPL